MKVIVLGTGEKGGIDSVINNIESNLNTEFDFKRYKTYLGKNKLQNFILAVYGLITVFIFSIFSIDTIFHLHMSYKGSFWRKYIYFKVANFFGKRVVVHLHGSEFQSFYESQSLKTQCRIKELILRSDNFIVLSDSWYAYINKITNDSCDNLKVIPNFAVVPPIPKIEKLNNHILFLGALIERKGIFDLLEVLAGLPNVSNSR